MTKPAVINHDETVSVSNTTYLIQGSLAHHISFLNAYGDFVYNESNNDTVSLQGTQYDTIYDQAQGMHLHLAFDALLTTVMGFQNDGRGQVYLSTDSYSSLAAIARSLFVIPGYGTELAAAQHGPIVAFFPGDYNVRLSQFHLVAGHNA